MKPKGGVSLNTHVSPAEAAWVKAIAKLRATTVTQVIREMIRADQARTLKERAIAALLCCAREGCLEHPFEGSLCMMHRQEAEAATARAAHAKRVAAREDRHR